MDKYKEAIANIDIYDQLEIDQIHPSEAIVKALRQSVECYEFTHTHSSDYPTLLIYEDKDYPPCPEAIYRFYPQMFIKAIQGVEEPRFIVRIDFAIDMLSPSGEKWTELFRQSRFAKLFKPCVYDSFEGFFSVFDTDIYALGSILTYYSYLLFTDPENIRINKSMHLNQKDLSQAILDESIKVPDTFRRALAKIMSLGIEDYDSFYVRIMPSDPKRNEDTLAIEVFREEGDILFLEQHEIGDEEAFQKQREYRNFNRMSYYVHDSIYHEINLIDNPEDMMRLYTDYFNFLYPDVGSPESIMASIAIVNSLTDEYVEYFFYPDGSEDPEEKLA